MVPNFVFYHLIGKFKKLLLYTCPINVLPFIDYYSFLFFLLYLN